METISAKIRTDRGKGAARRLRRVGQIPAIAYGTNVEAVSLSVGPKELLAVMRSEKGLNSLIELAVDGGKPLTVLLADYQHHPLTRELLHADFCTVSLDEPIDVKVPLELYGKAVGIVRGGELKQVYRSVPVRCLPANIPALLKADITELELDEHLPASAIEASDGVEIRLPDARTVASIIPGRKAKIDEDEEGEGEAKPADAEGADDKK